MLKSRWMVVCVPYLGIAAEDGLNDMESFVEGDRCHPRRMIAESSAKIVDRVLVTVCQSYVSGFVSHP
jgi:hypothetical protein